MSEETPEEREKCRRSISIKGSPERPVEKITKSTGKERTPSETERLKMMKTTRRRKIRRRDGRNNSPNEPSWVHRAGEATRSTGTGKWSVGRDSPIWVRREGGGNVI
jgi:hypothetical protein